MPYIIAKHDVRTMNDKEIEEKGEIEGIPYTVTNYRPPKGWRYFEVYNYLIKNKIPQLPFKQAILHILRAKYIPPYTKRGIKEITVYPEARIISLRCLETDIIFRKRWQIAKETGWYPNVTGVRLEESNLSNYVNRFIKENTLNKLRFEVVKKRPIILDTIASTSNKNAYLLRIGTFNVLLDAAMNQKDIEWLTSEQIVDLVIITHAHYDHASSIIDLYKNGLNVPVIATATTIDYIVQKNRSKPKEDVELFLKHAYAVPYNTQIKISDGLTIELYNAGHMPGSAMVFITVDDFKILYTGDFFLRDRLPVGGAIESVNQIPKPIDVLIVDCTFVDREFPSEEKIFEKLMQEVFVAWRGKGNVLFSADLGNTEIMLYLKLFSYFSRLGLKPPVYMDPQTINYMRILKSRINDLLGIIREFDVEIIDPFSSVMRKELRRKIDILKAISRPSIVISHPNNLDTLPITTYLKYLGEKEDTLIVLTGPQRSGVGKEILEGKKKFRIKYRPIGKREAIEDDFELKAQIFNIKYPDLIIASHADIKQIEQLLKSLKPTHVIPFHASPSQLHDFIKSLREKGTKVTTLAKMKSITLLE